jgi:hypothetical protein
VLARDMRAFRRVSDWRPGLLSPLHRPIPCEDRYDDDGARSKPMTTATRCSVAQGDPREPSRRTRQTRSHSQQRDRRLQVDANNPRHRARSPGSAGARLPAMTGR